MLSAVITVMCCLTGTSILSNALLGDFGVRANFAEAPKQTRWSSLRHSGAVRRRLALLGPRLDSTLPYKTA